jgi:hypothetical protein
MLMLANIMLLIKINEKIHPKVNTFGKTELMALISVF